MATTKLQVTNVALGPRKTAEVTLNGALTVKGFKVKKVRGRYEVIFPAGEMSIEREYIRDNIQIAVLEAFEAVK